MNVGRVCQQAKSWAEFISSALTIICVSGTYQLGSFLAQIHTWWCLPNMLVWYRTLRQRWIFCGVDVFGKGFCFFSSQWFYTSTYSFCTQSLDSLLHSKARLLLSLSKLEDFYFVLLYFILLFYYFWEVWTKAIWLFEPYTLWFHTARLSLQSLLSPI